MITQQLGNLPISITYIPDGTIALSPTAQFKGIVDGKAVFLMNGYTVDGVDYEYNVAIDYKEEPALLKWLQEQNLPQPTKEDIIRATQPFGFNFEF